MERRTKKRPHNTYNQSWLITFNDLITLLLTFFVLIISMSSVHVEKLQQLSSSLKQALIDFGATREVLVFEPFVSKPVFEEIEQKKLAKALEEEKRRQEWSNRLMESLQGIFSGQKGVVIAANQEGAELIMAAELLFLPGGTRLNDPRGYVKQLAALFSTLKADIVIESYSSDDDLPGAAGSDGSWGRARDRAAAVLRGLLAEAKLDASVFGLAGYGYRPITLGKTEAYGLMQKDIIRLVLKHIND